MILAYNTAAVVENAASYLVVDRSGRQGSRTVERGHFRP